MKRASFYPPFEDDEEVDDEVWAMRDYFWMVRSAVIEHSRAGWASFRSGYTAITVADLSFDSAPPPLPRHRGGLQRRAAA